MSNETYELFRRLKQALAAVTKQRVRDDDVMRLLLSCRDEKVGRLILIAREIGEIEREISDTMGGES